MPSSAGQAGGRDGAMPGAGARGAGAGQAGAGEARGAGAGTDTAGGGGSAPSGAGPKRRGPGIGDRVLAAMAAVGLAVALVAAGFGASAAPVTTAVLAGAVSAGEGSPYPADELAELAQATRAYTVEGREGLSAPREALAERVVDAARRAADAGSPTAGEWSARAREALDADTGAIETMEALARLSDRYALDADALSHLDDCNRLIGAAAPLALAATAAGALALAALMVRSRRALAGCALMAAPAVVIAAFAVLGLWGALDFNGLFAAFHAVLFPQGNWTFSWDSLLISMYPLAFWMGMAATWLAVTGGMSILSLVAGRRLMRRGPDRRS